MKKRIYIKNRHKLYSQLTEHFKPEMDAILKKAEKLNYDKWDMVQFLTDSLNYRLVVLLPEN